jgi:hypothetical protein
MCYFVLEAAFVILTDSIVYFSEGWIYGFNTELIIEMS